MQQAETAVERAFGGGWLPFIDFARGIVMVLKRSHLDSLLQNF